MKKQKTSIPQTPVESSILHQVKSLKKSWIATIVGAVLGGIVPGLIFDVAHNQTQSHPYLWVFVGAGLAFSATNVFKWSYLASKNILIAAGFTVLLEGGMTLTQGWTSWVSLGVLVGINAIAYAHSIVVGGKAVSVRLPGKKKSSRKAEKPLTTEVTSLNLQTV
jgi:hypothetical protein